MLSNSRPTLTARLQDVKFLLQVHVRGRSIGPPRLEPMGFSYECELSIAGLLGQNSISVPRTVIAHTSQ